MRIAFIVNKFPIVSEMFIANAASGLVQAGHDVGLFALHGRGDPGALNALGRRMGLLARARHPDVPAAMGKGRRARWLAAPEAFLGVARAQGMGRALTGLNPFAHRSRLSDMRPIHELAMWNGVGRPDIIHCQFGMYAEPMIRHRRAGAFDCPIVVHFRGHDIDPLYRRRGAELFDEIFAEADAVVANGGYFRDRLLAFGCPPEKLHMVDSPVDVGDFPFRPPEAPQGRPVRLLTVARLTEKKGLVYALEAVARLRAAGHDLRYRILGEGEDRTLLEDRIATLGLGGAVELLGAGAHDRVRAELAVADLFTAPSVTASNGEADAAVNVLKEAMLTGVPVVSTWHGGIPELVTDGETGLLVPERDSAALAAALEQLILDPGRWPRMALAGRAAAEQRFATPFVAARLLDIYGGAIDRRAGVHAARPDLQHHAAREFVR